MTHFFYNKLHIYQTRSRMIIVGVSKNDQRCRILKITRQDGHVLEAVEDNTTYTQQECNALLRKVNEGNMHHGGLQFVCKAHGIIGCFRLTDTYYIWVVTKKELVGHVCGGHKVYRIEEAQLLPLSCSYKSDNTSNLSVNERRYRKLLAGLDLTKNFFFSYTYNLSATLQRNLHDPAVGTMLFDNMFVWNSYLTRELRECMWHHHWTIPLIHGFWEQRCVSVFGRTIFLTLLARRSCHFAGTRFRKRGINDMGKVANEVETEQMVDAGHDYKTGLPIWTSHVQLRGSVPLYWSQQPGPLNAKPDIILQHFDPMYRVTHSHFQDLKQRYGNPIVVLNLLRSKERKKPRETLLRKELAAAVSLLNEREDPSSRVVYIPWDFQKYAKQQGANILLEISTLTNVSLEMTGLYVHGLAPPPGQQLKGAPPDGLRQPPVTKLGNGAVKAGGIWTQFQRGILRTNCIDCLDRTNVAQFAFGLMVFGRQLYEIGIAERPDIDSESGMAFQLMEMYEAMGNTLALQYGGSEAHNVFFQRKKGEWEAAAQSKDLMTSLRRFYNNTYTDAEKQDAINLFLGNFVPAPGKPHIWELESDVYLHWSYSPVDERSCQSWGPQPTPRLKNQKSLSAPNNYTKSGIFLSRSNSTARPAAADAAGNPFVSIQLKLRSSRESDSELTSEMQALQTNINGVGTTPRLTTGLRTGGAALLNTLSSEFETTANETPVNETGWDLRVVLNQLLGKDHVAPVHTSDSSTPRHRLTNFDQILAKQPRVVHVQLYEGRRSTAVLWSRLQNAFTFFWTLSPDGPEAGSKSSQQGPPISSYPPQPSSPISSSFPNFLSNALKPPITKPSFAPSSPLSPRSPVAKDQEKKPIATSSSTTSLIPALSSTSLLMRKSAPSFQVPSPTKMLADIRTHLMPSAPKAIVGAAQISVLNDILEFRSPDPVLNAQLNATLRGAGPASSTTSLLSPTSTSAQNNPSQGFQVPSSQLAPSSILSPRSPAASQLPPLSPHTVDYPTTPWGWDGEPPPSAQDMSGLECFVEDSDAMSDMYTRTFAEWTSIELDEFMREPCGEELGCSPEVAIWWDGAAGPNWHWEALQETAKLEHRRLSLSPLDLVAPCPTSPSYSHYITMCDHLTHEMNILVRDRAALYQ